MIARHSHPPSTIRSWWPLLAGAALAMAPVTALAHSEIRPTPDSLWDVWEVNSLMAIGLLVALWLYLRGTARLWARAGSGRGVRRWQVGAFVGGIASFAIARLSPLDALGGALFSAHMTQHLIVFLIAPMLFAASRPLLPLLWALPAGWRHALAHAWMSRPALRSATQAAGHWMAVLLLYGGVLWFWHVPALYDAALDRQPVHELEHLSFAVVAFLFWSLVLDAGRPGGIGHGAALLMVFATALQSGALGALITFADHPLYHSHEPYTAAWGMTPLEDQQLAGVIMWVPMGLWFTLTALVLVARWIGAADRSVRRLDPEDLARPASSLPAAVVPERS